MNVTTALQEHGPWLSMGELVKLTGQDAPTLRLELKEKIKDGTFQITGQKRGTRYALASAKVPDSKDDLDYKAAILEIMEEAKDHVSRKFLCEKLDTYDAKIRPSLLALVEEGIVVDNGKKKGQLFWLAKHEKAGVVEKPAPPAPKAAKPVEISHSEKPVVTDVDELVRMGVNSLMVGIPMLVSELKSEIMSVAQHNFSSSAVFAAFHRMFKDGKLPRMRSENRNQHGDGFRTFYWKENI